MGHGSSEVILQNMVSVLLFLWIQVRYWTGDSHQKYAGKEKGSPEHDIWYENHKKKGNCSKNFNGSGGSMEVDIAKELLGRSLSFNMRYKFMVCDGDSRAYSVVWDIYGCCETCDRYERLKRG